MVLIKVEDIKLSVFPLDLGPEFRTHYNYIHFLNGLSNGLSISENYNLTKTKEEFSKELMKKVRLIKTFKKSIDNEYGGIKEFHELSIINNTWIATKSYYLLFHMWGVVNYLIHYGNNNNLNKSHQAINNFIKEVILNKNILFSKEEFNEIYSYKQIGFMRCTQGENLRENYDKEKIKCFILKRIANSKIIDLKFNKKIDSFRKNKNKKIRNNFESSEKNILTDFFYMYRIKSHYRDLDFLGKSDNIELHFKYYTNYYELTYNFFNALKDLIDYLSEKRFVKKLMNN